MKKWGIATAAALVLGASSAFAADLPSKYMKAPPPPPPPAVPTWDIAFGSAIMSDYIFRGVTQSNHNPSVTAYFEPRYNINPNLQLYVGSSFESIAFANRAAAEVDIYGGIRPTFDKLALDLGVWGYLYPGGKCQNALNTGATVDNVISGGGLNNVCNNVLAGVNWPAGAQMKADVSFYEIYGKANYTFTDYFAMGANVFYSPNFLNFGTAGTYASATAKYTAPTDWFGSSGIGMYVSGEYGRQWLGTTDAFYGSVKLADYNTWNVGVGFTWKVFTVDLRYSDTSMNTSQCWLLTSAFNATGVPGNGQTNWCGAAFIAKLGADLTLMSNVK